MTCPLRTYRVLRRERVRTRLVLHIPRMNSSRDALRVIFATLSLSLPPLRLRPRASFSERRTRRIYKTAAGVYLDIFSTWMRLRFQEERDGNRRRRCLRNLCLSLQR